MVHYQKAGQGCAASFASEKRVALRIFGCNLENDKWIVFYWQS